MIMLITVLGGVFLTGIFGYGLYVVAKEFWDEEKRRQFMNEKRVEEERKNRKSPTN